MNALVTVTRTSDPAVTPQSITAFDYATLPADKAQSLRQSVAAIREIQRSAIADVGHHLIAVKALLDHGTFTHWAEAELGMTVRSVERYMSAAQFLAGKPDTVSLLPPTVIYALAAPTAPSAVVREVLAAAESGTLPPAKEIKAKLTSAIAAARKAKIEAKQQPERSERERERRTRAAKTARAARQAKEAEAAAARRRREEQERSDRLRPLAERVAAAIGPHGTAALIQVLNDWPDRETFRRLLSDTEARVPA